MEDLYQSRLSPVLDRPSQGYSVLALATSPPYIEPIWHGSFDALPTPFQQLSSDTRIVIVNHPVSASAVLEDTGLPASCTIAHDFRQLLLTNTDRTAQISIIPRLLFWDDDPAPADSTSYVLGSSRAVRSATEAREQLVCQVKSSDPLLLEGLHDHILAMTDQVGREMGDGSVALPVSNGEVIQMIHKIDSFAERLAATFPSRYWSLVDSGLSDDEAEFMTRQGSHGSQRYHVSGLFGDLWDTQYVLSDPIRSCAVVEGGRGFWGTCRSHLLISAREVTAFIHDSSRGWPEEILQATRRGADDFKRTAMRLNDMARQDYDFSQHSASILTMAAPRQHFHSAGHICSLTCPPFHSDTSQIVVNFEKCHNRFLWGAGELRNRHAGPELEESFRGNRGWYIVPTIVDHLSDDITVGRMALDWVAETVQRQEHTEGAPTL